MDPKHSVIKGLHCILKILDVRFVLSYRDQKRNRKISSQDGQSLALMVQVCLLHFIVSPAKHGRHIGIMSASALSWFPSDNF